MSFSDKWKQFKEEGTIFGNEDPPPSANKNPTAVTPAIVPTTFPQASPMGAPTMGLPEETKQAFVNELAGRVPDLKKLLDGAAAIASVEADFMKRLTLTATQLNQFKLFDAQEALSGLQEATAGIIQQLQNEVTTEETQYVTEPTRNLAQIEQNRQALLQQVADLDNKIGQAKINISTAQEKLKSSHSKCEAGVVFIKDWQQKMQSILSNLK